MFLLPVERDSTALPKRPFGDFAIRGIRKGWKRCDQDEDGENRP